MCHVISSSNRVTFPRHPSITTPSVGNVAKTKHEVGGVMREIRDEQLMHNIFEATRGEGRKKKKRE